MASRTTEQEARFSQPKRAFARVVGLGALVAAAVLAALLLLGSGGNGHTYELLFETGGQLVPGNEVQVAGQPVGTVDEITLTDDAQAKVTITVDDPLTEGTTALVRATSLSGIANRYVSLAPGPSDSPELEDGATIPADRTTSPVDLDQLFNAFDKRTRKGLQDVIQGSAAIYAGDPAKARETYKYFAPTLQASERLLAELTRDQRSFGRFLTSGASVFGALAERRDDLSALTQNGNEAMAAIVRENRAFDRSLSALPPAMRQANSTFVNLRAALDDLDPLVADTKVVAPDLAPFLRDLRPVARKAVPVVRDLKLAINLDGKNNDLTDALRDLPDANRSARNAVPNTIEGLDASQHLIEFMRPYSPDLLALVGKIGTATGYYDVNGKYIRAQPAGANLFDYNEATGELEPIPTTQQFDAYSAFPLGPFTRCPGGSTQANAGWPAPTDHPFLDDGALTGECEPADVPPGP
jgi:phospholipid/cholesterol/gamma-HCH transport system substrate-binding protein